MVWRIGDVTMLQKLFFLEILIKAYYFLLFFLSYKDYTLVYYVHTMLY